MKTSRKDLLNKISLRDKATEIKVTLQINNVG